MIVKFYGPKYSIKDFTKTLKVSDDTWNNIPNGDLEYRFYKDNKEVGLISFRRGTGQIGVMYLNEEYRGWGIGKDILRLAKKDIDTDRVWCVTIENHGFWKSRKDSVWKDPAHSSVTGSGYSFLIE